MKARRGVGEIEILCSPGNDRGERVIISGTFPRFIAILNWATDAFDTPSKSSGEVLRCRVY